MHKIGLSGGFLGRLLGPLLKKELHLIGNVHKALAKSFRINSSSIGKRCSYSSENLCYNINNFERINVWYYESSYLLKNLLKTSLEKSTLLIKGISKTIKNEAKEQKWGFLSMLLRITLGASLLGNLLTGKGTIRAGEGKIRASQVFLMPPYLLTDFEI